ncbi:MAG: AAA family ATPase [Tannerellaceae bacterium]|jgi:ATP-dependent metalloprotease FtsH|nr:AAA family ATPase [Tannerellaceae bacterium]
MDFSKTMRFVMVRAQAEAAVCKTAIHPEHLFLGLLKLAEVKAEDISSDTSQYQQITEDVRLVADRLHLAGIETEAGRQKLRRILRNEPPSGNGEAAIIAIFTLAVNKEHGSTITAIRVLAVMMAHPAPLLTAIFHLSPPEEKKEETGLACLPKLTARIRHMRYTLLEKVHGQDHVIHAFSEGMFSAEVLAASDEKRKNPRALFVFAGPPGVGKTFLAEQAAESLSIPFKRFDMSGYADHQAQTNLTGFAPSYKDARPGLLTGFVKNNPRCLLLFDEIEKAHLNTIQLFLQIIDAGTLHDNFMNETIAFRDTIIIFTTNAGRQLYEGNAKANAAGLPRQVILNALETDVHPHTGTPFFPPAICSRLSTGYPMMFNHLQAHDLEKISAGEFQRLCKLFEKQYGIRVNACNLLATLLLFAEGGQAGARTLRAQTELFFKNELFKLCRLWSNNFEGALEKLKTIRFEVNAGNLPAGVKPLFENPDQTEILFFGDVLLAEKLKEEATGVIIHATSHPEEALKIMGEKDVRFVLMELSAGNGNADPLATIPVMPVEPPVMKTIFAFDNVPIAAASLYSARHFFKTLRERLPEMPVYLLETDKLAIDSELLTAFIRAGARGKLTFPQSGDLGVLAEEITRISSQAYLQNTAAGLAAQRKIVSFETAPNLSADKTQAVIRLRELTVRRAVSAGDSGEVLNEVEKPNIRFNDVIGATDAKEELQFFVNYLKNPKKFSASGLKPPKGVLLYGPPGTGKTLLAKAIAGESDVAFIPAVASGFVTKYQGSGPEAVRALFQRARRYAPSIVFIDEIDAIGRARGNSALSGHGEEMALNALLAEMDGFSVDPKRPVFVLAATNFGVEEGKSAMGVIDAALARRFDRKIMVDLPAKEDRRRYLETMLHKRKNNQVTDAMIQRLSERSAGLSLADLELVLESASRMAARKNTLITDELLEEAFELNRHGEKKDWGREYLERVARHEAGHAYLCFLTGNMPSYLTIVARGEHGGYMEHAGDEGSPLKTKEELLGRIRTSLGGRAAEIVYYGEKEGVSSGASGDLHSATRIARAMICSYGMDEGIGMAVLSNEEATKGPLAEKITRRISEILKEELEQTIQILSKGKPLINKLVEQLLEKNKLTREEMEAVFRK